MKKKFLILPAVALLALPAFSFSNASTNLTAFNPPPPDRVSNNLTAFNPPPPDRVSNNSTAFNPPPPDRISNTIG
ncbi:hypothetical protein P4T44_05250 [Bacillus pseudomycoides]|uniref:hypothetical protein n=1 Tax=Bacillus pseudomycoides TaxID=64104 RepID=UPI002E225E0A|nr:hypothetical protein [Bacillus pseudomycoides]